MKIRELTLTGAQVTANGTVIEDPKGVVARAVADYFANARS